jgi:hypothetical protein
VLQRGDEGELHGLALLVAGLGRGIAVVRLQPLVRVGLDPQRFMRAARIVTRRSVVDREHAPGPPRDRVQAGVGSDPVEPRSQRASALHAGETLPGPQECVLEGILGVVKRAQHPVAVGLELPLVRLDEVAKRVLVAVPGDVEQLLLRCGS